MTRWHWVRASAMVLAFGTMTVAQSPAPQPTPTAFPTEGEVYTFRTAGQPERKVKVNKISSFADGEVLADVEDLATGARYTIPGKVLMSSARTMAKKPERVSVSPPPVTRPRSESTGPGAVKQTGFPTSLPIPPTPKGVASPFESRSALPNPTPNPTPTGTPKPSLTTGTTLLHGLGASLPPASTEPPVAVTYPRPDPQPDAPRVPTTKLPPNSGEPDQTLTPAPSGLVIPKLVAEPNVEFPIQPPSLVPGGINPPLNPSANPTPEPGPRAEVVLPQTPAPAEVSSPQIERAPPRIEVEVTPSDPTPAPAPMALPPTASLIQPVAMRSLTLVPQNLSGPAAAQMMDEVGPLVRDLSEALRPTVRERAATALVEGRYGWRPEVQALLARVAADDPAPSVRGHCIQLLAKLGYHESKYLDQLAGWAESDSIRVREAARAALAKLGPRN